MFRELETELSGRTPLPSKLPRTRWLVFSSHEQGRLVREAVSLGVHGFVMKRSDLATLRTAISTPLRGEQNYCHASAWLLVVSAARAV